MRGWLAPIPLVRWLMLALLLGQAETAAAAIITQLPGKSKLVALTFDACETRTPSFLDRRISDYLLGENIPFTIFVAGRFARHNREILASLSRANGVEIENHSMNHDNHMDRLDDQAIRREVTEADDLLAGIIGHHTRYFRFPAGNASPHAVELVESMGYKVVHWSFASGDPVKVIGPEALSEGVLQRVRPGSILIFHINGRGWSTADALPGIIAELRKRGYGFTRLDAVLP
jgi:peptidoglycan/xylan/chitin deacetylase (PgdA/CDA1 family)